MGIALNGILIKQSPEVSVGGVAFRLLAAGNHPDVSAISDFRKLHLKALGEPFKHVFSTNVCSTGQTSIFNSSSMCRVESQECCCINRRRIIFLIEEAKN